MSEEQPKVEEKVITEEELKASMERKAKEAENGSNDMLRSWSNKMECFSSLPGMRSTRLAEMYGKPL